MFANYFGRFENVECGLVHLEESGENTPPKVVGIPLDSVAINAIVVHAITKVELTQVFVNKGARILETVYYFPVDSNGGVVHFQAELDGRLIKGVIKSQEAAQAQYDRAIGQKQSDFPVEANRPDTFKVRIGFLKPERQVKIVIHYVTEVRHERGTNAMGFHIPNTLVPRYITSAGTEAAAVPLTVTVNVGIQGKIRSIESRSHEIDVERTSGRTRGNWTKSTVTFAGTTRDMDNNFELQILPEEIFTPRVYSERLQGSTALMAHLTPRFTLPKQRVELIFLLDRSGSMVEFSIALAKRALRLFLHSLPIDCYFNIVGFGYDFKFLFPDSRKYNEDSLREAIRYTEALSADMGGTEILEPLLAIIEKDRIPGYNKQIFVLTDGAVSNPEQVIALCESNAKTVRFFTLGIGRAVSRFLVEGMAWVSGGRATFVDNNEHFESEVLQHLANAVEHSLTNIKLRWTGMDEPEEIRTVSPTPTIDRLSNLMGRVTETISRLSPSPTPPSAHQQIPSKFRQIPTNVPPVFDGQQLVVFGLFPGATPTGVEIEAESPEGPVSISMPIPEANDSGDIGMLHQLATIKAIRQMELREMELAELDDKKSAKEREELRKDIVYLSIQHGLVSKYTAYVAIDEKSEDDNWVIQTRYDPKYVHGRWLRGNETFSFIRDDSTGSERTSSSRIPYRDYDEDSENRSGSGTDSRPGSRSSGSRSPTSKPSISTNYQEEQQQQILTLPPRPPRKSPLASASTNVTQFFRRANNQDRLQSLVATQSYDGSFSLTNNFADVIGKSLPALVAEARRAGWDEEAWATAIALSFMTNKMSGLKESWELVAEKSKKWLQNNYSEYAKAIVIAADNFINIETVI